MSYQAQDRAHIIALTSSTSEDFQMKVIQEPKGDSGARFMAWAT